MAKATFAEHTREHSLCTQHFHWTYMQNNIRSNKESSVDWLHKKLAIFARLEPDSDCEDEDALDVSLLGNKKKLKMYLQKKVREDQLVQVGDERYALPK